MSSNYNNIKSRCLNANLEIKNNDLSIYTFGNVSLIDRKNNIVAIKPSGVPYNDLKIDDIVILNLKGEILEGNLRPSSDTKTHIFLYNNWGHINSICHTHSTFSVGWAQSLTPVPILGTTHADHLTQQIPCTEPMEDILIKGDYELNTGKQIISHFKNNNIDYKEVNMCLVGSHGPFTWGVDEIQSVYNSVVLEELCKMAFITKTINPNINSLKNSLISKHYQRKHGKDSYYGQK
ncbi:MAG: L-ribulose-5-phosphate 4-epimerase AraD [Flavobacteriaceae bacterium]|jgi:L-ribulose-5-phosphate 4-epimerase|nr:L-ribulose-5-phosphate 4-epimerase AraD [Flavobacteriaceae bacterium]